MCLSGWLRESSLISDFCFCCHVFHFLIQKLRSFFQSLRTIATALPNMAEYSMLYECRASSVEALRTAMEQLWRFIMHNCSTGEGSIKDETNLESLPAEDTQKVVPQQSVTIETKLF